MNKNTQVIFVIMIIVVIIPVEVIGNTRGGVILCVALRSLTVVSFEDVGVKVASRDMI